LFVLPNNYLCFYSETNKCTGGSPLKCDEVDARLAVHSRLTRTASLMQEIKKNRQRANADGPMLRRALNSDDSAPDYEPNTVWGDAGCIIC